MSPGLPIGTSALVLWLEQKIPLSFYHGNTQKTAAEVQGHRAGAITRRWLK
jgi:hypothetical protein